MARTTVVMEPVTALAGAVGGVVGLFLVGYLLSVR